MYYIVNYTVFIRILTATLYTTQKELYIKYAQFEKDGYIN